jgi:cell division FtsZ-interacting protein ZapD
MNSKDTYTLTDPDLRAELFETVHRKRAVLTWLEWEKQVTDDLVEVVQRRVEEARQEAFMAGQESLTETAWLQRVREVARNIGPR